MPQARSRTAASKVTTAKESVSSATQLGNFGVRAAKFTHRVSDDTAANFLSNITLPASSAILGVSFEVTEAYNGTTVTADIQAGGSTIITTPISVATTGVSSAPAASLVNESGELGITFSATNSTEGEMTVVVAYIDLAQMK